VAKIQARIISRIVTTVTAGQTKDVDTVSASKVNGLRYFVAALGNSLVKTLDLSLARDNGVLNDSVFGRNGTLPMSINAVESGGNVLIKVINPNGFDIEIELNKILLKGSL